MFLQHVRKDVAPQWRDLGMLLLEEKLVSRLNIIKANNPGDVEGCCTDMFQLWLNADTEASWDTLIKALIDIQQNVLAEKIKEEILKGIATYI